MKAINEILFNESSLHQYNTNPSIVFEFYLNGELVNGYNNVDSAMFFIENVLKLKNFNITHKYL